MVSRYGTCFVVLLQVSSISSQNCVATGNVCALERVWPLCCAHLIKKKKPLKALKSKDIVSKFTFELFKHLPPCVKNLSFLRDEMCFVIFRLVYIVHCHDLHFEVL